MLQFFFKTPFNVASMAVMLTQRTAITSTQPIPNGKQSMYFSQGLNTIE